MKNSKENHNLLSNLQSLYKKLALIVVDFRKNAYRYVSSNDKKSNIKSIINAQIDELVMSYENIESDKDSSNSNNNDTSKRSAGSGKDNKNIEVKKYQAGRAVENEFSKYLKMENLTSVTQPGIVAKLTESIWEHVHAALRIARNGDAEKARLHLDIVDQALNEVGNYMDSDDFSRLVNSVEQYLIKL